MRIVFAIARREFSAYFEAPIGWICLFCFVGITGLFFTDAVSALPELVYAMAMSNPYTANIDIFNRVFIPQRFQFVLVLLIFICPAITMRLFSTEYRNGTIEFLLSSPVSSTQIVFGKYIGSLGFLAVLIAGILPQIFILLWMGNASPGVVAGGLIACVLVGAAYIAVGMIAGAFTDEQLLAGILSFCTLLAMLVLTQLDPTGNGTTVTDLEPWDHLKHNLKIIISNASIHGHMSSLIRGSIRLSDLIYFISFITMAIILTSWRIESRRWR